jgi:hypothetical protein
MGIEMNAVTTIEAERPQLWLEVPADQSFEEWQATGEKLCRTERVLNWWIGDWWAAGHHRYGERAKVAAEGIFGVGFQAVADMATVCRSFEPSRRREVLSFTHHRETAALPPSEADALLERAEVEGMATRAVRVEAMKRKVALGLFKPRDELDDDPEHTALMGIARQWNRAPVGARMAFMDLAGEADFGVIDP